MKTNSELFNLLKMDKNYTYIRYRCICLQINRQYVHVSRLLIVTNLELNTTISLHQKASWMFLKYLFQEKWVEFSYFHIIIILKINEARCFNMLLYFPFRFWGHKCDIPVNPLLKNLKWVDFTSALWFWEI